MIRRFAFFLILLFAPSIVVDAQRTFTLVIDAGHGGHDAGAIGAISKEKNINLSVALEFGRMVEAKCPDVKVVYTRKTDVFVPLHERASIANRNKADLFISIHTNAVPKGKNVRGLETYTLGMHRAGDNLDVAKRENSVILYEENYQQHYEGFDPNSSESYIMFEFLQDKNMEQSVELARLVQQRTCAIAGRIDKGVKQAGFLVLRETSMPSCLIELGFISTPTEEQYLNSTGGIYNLSLGIYQAFLAYKQRYASGGSKSSIKTEEPASAPLQTPEEKKQVTVQQEEKSTTPPKHAEPVVEQSLSSSSEPVFKVQIFASTAKVESGSLDFKGEKNTDYYQENGLYKYTIGNSTDYNYISNLRRTLSSKFSDCFIIAFKEGKKIDVNAAIREFNSKNK